MSDPTFTSDSSIPALIPAAGEGTRLRPITRFLSKPMLPIGNRPVIDFIIKEADGAGCDPIVIVGQPGDRDLKTYVDGMETEAELRWTDQNQPRGLAHALCRGYDVLTQPRQTVLLLPDNVALGGNPTRTLLETDGPRDVLWFGTIDVPPEQAPYFGNSGSYESADSDEYGPGIEVIRSLQEKGNGTFERQIHQGRSRRTVGRVVLPEEFFRRARNADPDPVSGEVDDVPIYRAMIQSSFALGVGLTAQLHDMGEPERYLRLCARFFDRRASVS